MWFNNNRANETMTRKTRMIFVEEVTDTERESNVYNSFEMESNVSKSDATAPSKQKEKKKQKKKRKSPSKPFKEESQNSSDIGDMESWVVESPNKKMKDLKMAETYVNEHPEKIDFVSESDQKEEREESTAASSDTRANSAVSIDVKSLPNMFRVSSTKSTSQPFTDTLMVSTSDISGNSLPNSRKPSMVNSRNMPNSLTKIRFLHHEADEMKSIEEALLYQKLRSIFRCMMMTGIFFVRRQRTSGGSGARFFKNCTYQQTYCTVILVILALNFIRSLTAFSNTDFTEFGSELFFKLLTSIFFYESMSRAYLAYVAAYRKNGGLRELFLKLERICYPDGIIPYEDSLKRISNIFIILTFIISAANVGVTAYGFFGKPEAVRLLFDNYLTPVPPDVDGILAFKIFLLILTFFNAQVAILTVSFYAVICIVLYKEFEYFCRTFSMKIREDGTFTDDLEKFRISHQRRCKLVEQADQMFKYYIANTYMTNIPLLCVLLYSVVHTEYDESYRFISAFRLCYVLLQMLMVSAAATIINSQAHAPLASIYSIRVQPSTSSERQLEVNMFLNKLTGTQVGLTAWDMFVINKPAVLTVIGMILTYFLLLIQFKNPLGTSTCNCLLYYNGTNISLAENQQYKI